MKREKIGKKPTKKSDKDPYANTWPRFPGPCLSGDDKKFHKGYNKFSNAKDYDGRLDFCRNYLAAIKAGRDGDPNEPECLARAAVIGWYLSNELERRDIKSALTQLTLALEDAIASGYHDVQHSCLHTMGHLYHHMGENETAARYYQRALPYSWYLWPNNFLSDLQFMAYTWSTPENIDKAIMMFDWMLLLEPKNTYTMREKYEAMARNGKSVEVQIDTPEGTSPTCESYAHCAAASFALKRYDEAAEISQAGLRLAKRKKDRGWKAEFTKMNESLTKFTKVG